MPVKIGLITTLNKNIGDDFIREGLCSMLRDVLKGHEIQFVPVNKHQPLTVYPDWHPAHLARITSHLFRGSYAAGRLIERYASKLRLSAFDTCDIVVQCGAPVLWPGCHRCAWAEPLWHHVIGRLYQRVSVLNLAAGSCYPWEEQPIGISNADDAEYLQAILRYCRLTTVRDPLAQCLCASLGAEAPLIPCTAFLAAGDQVSEAQNDGVILINYMFGGGHYQFNQGISASAWRKTVQALIGRLRRRHKLVFLCHNEAEYQLAWNLDSTLLRLWPKTPQEYLDFVSKARVALCNRMHASVMLAGLGIPSIAVGTDTRLLMVKPLGLPYLFVKEADADQLEDKLEDLLTHYHWERLRLLELKADTLSRYVEAIRDAI